jgi:hypothetical protein
MKLTRVETAWVEAEMQAIFPGSSDEGLTGIGAMDVRGFITQTMRYMPPQAALGFRVAVWVVALAPLLLLGRLATIAGLALPDREKVIGRLVASKSYAIRSFVLILKTLGALLYAGDDGVRARMTTPAAPASAPRPLVTLRTKRVHAA